MDRILTMPFGRTRKIMIPYIRNLLIKIVNCKLISNSVLGILTSGGSRDLQDGGTPTQKVRAPAYQRTVLIILANCLEDCMKMKINK